MKSKRIIEKHLNKLMSEYETYNITIPQELNSKLKTEVAMHVLGWVLGYYGVLPFENEYGLDNKDLKKLEKDLQKMKNAPVKFTPIVTVMVESENEI